jgi:hypothetical protein
LLEIRFNDLQGQNPNINEILVESSDFLYCLNQKDQAVQTEKEMPRFDTFLAFPDNPCFINPLHIDFTMELPPMEQNVPDNEEKCHLMSINSLLSKQLPLFYQEEIYTFQHEMEIDQDEKFISVQNVPETNFQESPPIEQEIFNASQYDERAKIVSFQKSPSTLFDQFLENTLFAEQ